MRLATRPVASRYDFGEEMAGIGLPTGVSLATYPVSCRFAVGILALASGCGDNLVDGSQQEEVLSFSAQPTTALDVLVVTFDSASTLQMQLTAAGALDRFFDVVNQGPAGPLDVHLGVATSDLGTPGQNACSVPATAAQLVGGECLASGAFLSLGADGTSNVPGGQTRADVLSCLLVRGVRGCGYEQPLEVMRRVLASPGPGFLRPGAHLGVVLVADQDDCSASDPALFATGSAPYGPGGPHRCYADGVVCDQGPALAEIGLRTGCRPIEAPTYLHPVQVFVDALRAHSPAPASITVGVIAGDPTPFEVFDVPATDSRPTFRWVASSCIYGEPERLQSTRPPIRLDSFAAAFAERGVRAPLCGDTPGGMAQFARQVRKGVGDGCLAGRIASAPGGDAPCTVAYRSSSGGAELPWCRDNGPPCWRLRADPDACAGYPSTLRLQVDGLTDLPGDAVVDGRCAVR